MGHYLGHYNDLTEVIIIFWGSGCTDSPFTSLGKLGGKVDGVDAVSGRC